MAEKDELAKLIVAMGAIAGGGQTHEQVQYNSHTQVAVQILQSLGLVLAVAMTAGGLYLLGSGLAWVLEASQGRVPDLLLLSMGISGAALAGRAAGDWLLEHLGQRVGRLAWTVLEAVALMALVLAGLSVAEMALAGGGVSPGAGVRLVVGLGLVAAGLLLGWRFGNELFNPLFPASPALELLQELLAQMAGEEPVPQVRLSGPVPVRSGGQPARPVLMQGLPPQIQAAAEAGEVEIVPDPEYLLFMDLVAFVDRAATHGLTREANVIVPRVRLPSGERLTRGRLEALWVAGAEWGLWSYEREKGQSPEWLMSEGIAIQVMQMAWERESPAARVAPSPDPSPGAVGEGRVVQAGRQASRQAGTQGY